MPPVREGETPTKGRSYRSPINRDLPKAPAPAADLFPAAGVSFFGRIIALDIACPRCAQVHVLRDNKGRRVWDPQTGIFQCHGCGVVLQLGILAWHAPAGIRRIPEDHIPLGFRQALQLRELARNVLRGERVPTDRKPSWHYRRKTPRNQGPATNRVAPVSCCCTIDVKRDPACVIHGERARSENLGP